MWLLGVGCWVLGVEEMIEGADSETGGFEAWIKLLNGKIVKEEEEQVLQKCWTVGTA